MRNLYKWTLHKKALLFEKLLNVDIELPEGISSLFVELTATIGVKLYFEKEDRDYAVQLQNKAYRYGLGPQVGSKFNFKWRNIFPHDRMDRPIPDEEFDPYISQIVRVYGYVTQVATVSGRLSLAKRISIVNRLNSIGIDFDDKHEWNFGKIGNKIVCIDFGKESAYIS